MRWRVTCPKRKATTRKRKWKLPLSVRGQQTSKTVSTEGPISVRIGTWDSASQNRALQVREVNFSRPTVRGSIDLLFPNAESVERGIKVCVPKQEFLALNAIKGGTMLVSARIINPGETPVLGVAKWAIIRKIVRCQFLPVMCQGFQQHRHQH